MTSIPTASGFPTSPVGEVPQTGIRQTGGPLNPADDRLDGLTPEAAAVLIGFRTVADVEALAPAADRPYIRDALTNRYTVERALATAGISRQGTPGPSTREQRARPILERAAITRASAEQAEQQRARRDAANTCPVLGAVDPTTRQRKAPWSATGVRCSDTAYRALMRAWLADAPDTDVAQARDWLIDQGILTQPQPKRRGRRN